MDQERLSFIALHFTPGIGDFLVKQLVSYCGSASQVFKTPKSRLLQIPGVGEKSALAITNQSAFDEAEKELKRADRDDVEIILYSDKKYPHRLKPLDDAPAILYCKGNQNLNLPKAIAIVGTRQATEYGKEVVEQICKELVPHEALILSGLAYGIDIHAHKAALKNKLPTVGIMGSGIDTIYPAAHKETARKMIEAGALLTENRFGTKPDAHNFPARNRIIAGMCDALIVVEAGEKGGALITADIANSYNKDVFAVPGNLLQAYSAGCNKLIKTNRANLFTSVKDLEYIMNWSVEKTAVQPALELTVFDADEQTVLRILKESKEPVMIDELSLKSLLPPSQLASLLLTLEFKNAVKALPGKRFALR
ncbi:MAG: DNA-processing protein DprA [Cytophagales bacterium]|nr:DNA-processing protein DprA [Cytophagales bacterium]